MDGLFTVEIYKLRATKSCIEEELGRIRSRLDNSLREYHTLQTKADKLHHDLQVLQSQNKNLYDKLV